MLGKLNPNSSEHQRLEASLIVTLSVKPSNSSTTQGKPRQAGELNFFTYLDPLERDLVLANYKAFPVSSELVDNSRVEGSVTARLPRDYGLVTLELDGCCGQRPRFDVWANF